MDLGSAESHSPRWRNFAHSWIMAAIMGEFITRGENGGNVGNAQPATSSPVLPQRGDAQCQRGIPLPGAAGTRFPGGMWRCTPPRAVFLPGAGQSSAGKRPFPCHQRDVTLG